MDLRAELLINTRSRAAKSQKNTVLDALKAEGVIVEHVYEISSRYTIDTALKQIKKRLPKLLIIGGGDGTFSSVVDRLVGVEIELGLIPLGTTNNFARSLAIPLNIFEAAQTVATKKARHIDLGKLNDEHFTNVAGIGLSAHIAGSISNVTKHRFGRAAYAIEGCLQLWRQPSFFVTLRDPDYELSLTFETRQVIVANGRYHAGTRISEDASVDNKQLIIFALGGHSRLSLLWHMIDFYLGKRKSVAHASYLVGRRVEIRTSIIQPIELDGEVKLNTPALAVVETAAIQVRY